MLLSDAAIIRIFTPNNPRKQGTHGYRSFQVLLEGGEMTIAEYLRRGGRRNDLAWDVQHGWAELVGESEK